MGEPENLDSTDSRKSQPTRATEITPISAFFFIFSCVSVIYIAITIPLLFAGEKHEHKKHLLLVGGGWNQTYNNFWYQTAKMAGYELSIADIKGHFTEQLASTPLIHSFFVVNLRASEAVVADELTHIITHSGIRFHGILTFKDGFLVAVAEAASRTGLPTLGVQIFEDIRNKEKVRGITASTVPCKRIRSEKDLSAAASVIGYPAVLKPVSGEGSIAVRQVHDLSDLHEQYRQLKSFLSNGQYGTMKHQDFLLESLVEGSEHDVDIIIQNGVALFSSVSDEHEMLKPWFQETGRTTPSKLAIKDQQLLSDFAIKACQKIGASDGVFHVEVMYTNGKVHLVEINGRAGGLLVKHSIEAVWRVNIFKASFQIAAGDRVTGLSSRGILDGSIPKIIAINKYPNSPRSGFINGEVISSFLHLPELSLAVKMTTHGMKIYGPEESAPWWLALLMFVTEGDIQLAEERITEATSKVDVTPFISASPLKKAGQKSFEELLAVANTPVLGMEDIYGKQRRRFHVVSRVLEDVIYQYGYDELQIPLLERSTSFSEDIVGQSPWPEWDPRGCFYFDIVDYQNGFSQVKDKASVLLVPEGTLSVARWLGKEIATNRENIAFPLKIFYNLPCFRNEPVDTLSHRKKRQFDQFGVEILGTRNLGSDVEIIWVLANMMERMGIPRGSVIARVSNVQILSRLLQDSGIPHKDGIRLKEAMDEMAECRAKKADRCVETNEKSFWKILNNYTISEALVTSWKAMIHHDNGKVDSHLRASFPQSYGSLFDELQTISEELLKHGINVIADLCVVRSHEYYTHFSFEIDVVVKGKRYLEIAGGGRYDKLVGHFLGVNPNQDSSSKPISVVPSTGFAFGMQRVIAMLEDSGLFESPVWSESIKPIPIGKSTADVLLVPDIKQHGVVRGYLQAQMYRTDSDKAKNWSRVDTFIGDGWASPDSITLHDLAEDYRRKHNIDKVVFLGEN